VNKKEAIQYFKLICLIIRCILNYLRSIDIEKRHRYFELAEMSITRLEEELKVSDVE
jgi:hypothetical protein